MASPSFGNQIVGTSSTLRTATLKNNASISVPITNITTSADFPMGTGTGVCSTTISANASCLIYISFAPISLGLRSATLQVIDSAGSSPQPATANLTGTGTSPVTISPTALTFTTAMSIGTTSAPQTIKLTNNLATQLMISSSIAASADFAIAANISNKCGSTLGAGLSCFIGVTFTPTVAGTRNGILTINYGGFGSPAAILLTGTGNAAGLVSIAVTPTNPSMALGLTQQFTATGTFTGPARTANLTASVTWASALAAVATISNTVGRQGIATTVGQGSTGVTATLGTVSGSTNFTVTAPTLSSLSITSVIPSIPLAKTQQFTATGTYTNGSTQNLTNTVTWSTTVLGVATVSNAVGSQGIVTSVGQGTTGLIVTLGSNVATTSLTVTAPILASLAITPANPLIPLGVTQQFAVIGTYTDESTQDLTSTVSWSSLTSGVATIGSTGLATAVAQGQATISAILGTVNSSTLLTVTAGFVPTGSLPSAFYGHTATVLNDGMVLIAGGYNNSTGFLASAEIYDPATGTFTPTGNLTTARQYHTATLLTNGTVLIAGGIGSSGNVASAELYDPTTRTFTTIGSSLITARRWHTATLLKNGLVLIAGGINNSIGGFLASAELFNPATATFTSVGNMTAARFLPTATLLNNGLVLIAGGVTTSSGYLSTAELFNPQSGTFAPTGSLSTARYAHTATLLNNGLVVVAGGYGSSNTYPANAELYNPTTGTFGATGNLKTARGEHEATLLNNGMVLIEGGTGSAGFNLSPAELYDPANGTFVPTGSLTTGRSGHTATLLNNGMVLIVGGSGSSGSDPNVARAELYEPGTLTPPNLVSISLSPVSSTVPLGISQLFTAAGTFSDSSTQTLASVSWSSSNSNSAPITNDSSNHGTTYAAGVGSTTISACAGTVCGSTQLTVIPVSDPAPSGMTAWWPGEGNLNDVIGNNSGTNAGTVTFAQEKVGQGFHFDDSPNSYFTVPDSATFAPASNQVTIAAWVRPNFAISNVQDTVFSKRDDCSLNRSYLLTVTKAGLAPAIPTGSIYWSASIGGDDAIGTTLFPSDGQFHFVSGTYDGTVMDVYLDGVLIGQKAHTGPIPTTSEPPYIGKQGGCGDLTAADIDELQFYNRALSQAEILAIVNAGSSGVTPPTLLSIAVTPQNPSQPFGNSQQFTAMGSYNNGDTRDVTTSVQWSSSNLFVATINSAGLSSTFGTGGTTITATIEAIFGRSTFTVTPPVLTSIAVTPANPSIQAGGTQQFTATGTYTDASTQDLTASVTWSSTATGVATISATGLATGVSQGQTTVVATSGSVNGQVTLTVTPGEGFISTGMMNTGRFQNTATVLNNGKVLIAGGYNGTVPVETAELYDPATGSFAPTGSMSTGRFQHTATLLNNGKVLIVGGSNGSVISSAELYDPATGAFTSTGSMNDTRTLHIATLLSSGKVLITGGYSGCCNTFLATAELYDPVTGTFSLLSNMNYARYLHTATLLNDGRVLIAGGSSGSSYPSVAELYDPATGSFTVTGSMTTSRVAAAATLLNNGKVLLTAGFSQNYLGSAELYDPATGRFTSTGNLATFGLHYHAATLLNDGRVLIAGGSDANEQPTASAEVYDPVAGTFSVTGSLVTARTYAQLTLLTNGKVLGAGGVGTITYALPSAELFTPLTFTPPALVSIAVTPTPVTQPVGSTQQFVATGTFSDSSTQQLASVTWLSSDTTVAQISNDASDHGTALATAAGSATITACTGSVCGSATLNIRPTGFVSTSSLNKARYAHTATLLSNGMVLIVGGSDNSSVLPDAELYNPAAGIFTPTGSLSTAREKHTATLLNNGTVLIAGGFGSTGHHLSSAELYDPATGTFTPTGSLNAARSTYTATLLKNGMVLIVAGEYDISLLSSAELYDPTTGTFTLTGSLSTARDAHTATLLNNGTVLIAGGVGFSGNLASAELFDPATGAFTPTASLNAAREFHTAALMNNGLVLIAGGDGDNGILSSAELYDPTSGPFTLTGSLNSARRIHTATLLNNGMVLIAAGLSSSGYSSSAELYDPTSGTFTLTGSLNTARYFHTATLLDNGTVLIVGGIDSNTAPSGSAELY
jgi:hypothetical protein